MGFAPADFKFDESPIPKMLLHNSFCRVRRRKPCFLWSDAFEDQFNKLCHDFRDGEAAEPKAKEEPA